MGLIILIILIVLIIVIASSLPSENITSVRDSGENTHPQNMGRKDSKQAGHDPSNMMKMLTNISRQGLPEEREIIFQRTRPVIMIHIMRRWLTRPRWGTRMP